jgi:hypothetical protein
MDDIRHKGIQFVRKIIRAVNRSSHPMPADHTRIPKIKALNAIWVVNKKVHRASRHV